MRPWSSAALCLSLLLPAGARAADDIGPAQAQALQQQLKDWLTGLLGPSIPLPDLPFRITGERDRYRLTWPIPGLAGPAGEAAAKAEIRPLDGGRWSIESMTVPPSGAFAVTVPDGNDAGGSVPMEVEFKVGRQETRGVIDPSFGTPSTLRTEMADIAVETESDQQRQEQRFDRYKIDTSLTPAKEGRLDLVMDAAIDGWKSVAQTDGGAPVAIGIQSLRATGRVDGVNRDRVAAMLAATGGLIGALPPDFATTDKDDLPPAARAQLRLLVESLRDMVTRVSLEETLEGVQVEIAGFGGGSLKRLVLGFGGETVEGRLRAWLDLGLDELRSPSLPPKVAAYLPRRIAIKPTLSGILMSDLQKLLLNATEPGADADSLAPDIVAMFANGGINLGLETLAFDLGPAKVEGKGQVTVTSPDTWKGQARLTATGFDELTTQARSNPDLQQAIPVLIMVRGLAKPDGPRLVWDIVSNGPTVTVNGLDLSQLGNEKPKGKPAPQRPAQPQSR